MIEKAYFVFLCFLLISVLFFPLTTAGRVLLDTPQKEYGSGNRGNGGDKMGVRPSYSNPAHSATGHSSPSHATPSRKPVINTSKGNPAAIVSCGDGIPYSHCKPGSNCNKRNREC